MTEYDFTTDAAGRKRMTTEPDTSGRRSGPAEPEEPGAGTVRAKAAARLEAFREGAAGLLYFPRDAAAIYRRDPALHGKALGFLEVVLYASFWALLLYRLSHFISQAGLSFPARLVSQAARLLTGIEIHPGARIGPGLFIDHGMGTVIGETAIIGRNVLLFQGVTLGGVEFVPGRRHPEVGDDVLVGAGAKVLGAITIGAGAKIGAQAVVLEDVPAGATAVGIPARIIRRENGASRELSCCAGTH